MSTAAVTAVYVDELEKKRRANGVIVTGLKPSPTHSDHRLFSNLCSSELSIEPDIAFNKRLGQITPGKTQPLLVIMRDPIQAQQVTAKARLLRKSTNQDVAKNVFINANLTRAEAAAEYQLRVQRRARRRGDIGTSTAADLNSGHHQQLNTKVTECSTTVVDTLPSLQAPISGSQNTCSSITVVATLDKEVSSAITADTSSSNFSSMQQLALSQPFL
jgi:hypothetical protein